MTTLDQLKIYFKNRGCEKFYIKRLLPNDNSKNQVYLGGSFDILNIFPISEIHADSSGDWKRDRFKVRLEFYWFSIEDFCTFPAPNAQLILYPKYPEVRFSGFLKGCKKAPSKLMTERLANRLLFFGVIENKIIGYVAHPDAEIASEFNLLNSVESHGVFHTIDLIDSKALLLSELKRIHELGWIKSKRLNKLGTEMNCNAPNCGGYTLEAELGVTPNGYSEPDFLGWEIKQYGVSNFQHIKNKPITLMTPEPNAGIYKEKGVEHFLRNYGYKDKKGRLDRINFGGVHKVGQRHKTTGLTLTLIGFDATIRKITNSDGRISLLNDAGEETASWTFVSLIAHWNKKHHQACYIPSLSLKEPFRQYRYSQDVLLGQGTEFLFFLNQMSKGNIYYDPGIKMENASVKPKIKRRSQFRMKSGNIVQLYKSNEVVDLLK